jgi:hypothetical protein
VPHVEVCSRDALNVEAFPANDITGFVANGKSAVSTTQRKCIFPGLTSLESLVVCLERTGC